MYVIKLVFGLSQKVHGITSSLQSCLENASKFPEVSREGVSFCALLGRGYISLLFFSLFFIFFLCSVWSWCDIVFGLAFVFTVTNKETVMRIILSNSYVFISLIGFQYCDLPA